jgi:hypothetical protein
MMSLVGDSKKIPLDLTSNSILSISKLGEFAKDTDYFRKKKGNGGSPTAQRYHPEESIQEEEERAE